MTCSQAVTSGIHLSFGGAPQRAIPAEKQVMNCLRRVRRGRRVPCAVIRLDEIQQALDRSGEPAGGGLLGGDRIRAVLGGKGRPARRSFAAVAACCLAQVAETLTRAAEEALKAISVHTVLGRAGAGYAMMQIGRAHV